MSDDDSKLWIEEFKELGQEYRYRDQMMVQEFGLSMVAIGIVINRLWTETPSWEYLGVQLIGGFFLFVVARHLDHINQDRRAALESREELRKKLGFTRIHLGADGRRFSAPRTMVWFATALIPAWAVWTVISIVRFLA